ncbi:MAG TPA: hypothetical protein VGI82_10605 [Chitinophagaceae bacterium]
MQPKALFPVFLVIVIVSFSLQCKKDKVSNTIELPPITQEGKNTFGCRVNGKVWIPSFKCQLFGNQCAELEYTVIPQFSGSDTSLFFSLSAGNDAGNHQYFVIAPVRPGSFIKGVGNYSDSISVNFFGYLGDFWKYDATFTRMLYPVFNITTIDAEKKVVAGTFSFTLFTQDLKDSAVITDGRFDLQFGDYCRCSPK